MTGRDYNHGVREMVEPKKSDRSGWGVAVSGAVGALLGTVITATINHFDHKADMDAKMIELGIGILRAESTPETRPLREWATDLIEKRGNFNFSPNQKAALLNKPLPFVSDAHLASQIGLAVSNAIKSQPQP